MESISQQPNSGHNNYADPGKIDAVRATQFGNLERLRQIVQEEKFDVRQPDAEKVTLLHWAAINNRSEIVSYVIKMGAEVDALGGNLGSTPLHWAVRQGLLRMVVQLMSRHGADPTVADLDGCSCLHVAAQIGNTAVLAYIIAKGAADVNLRDAKGMTPLAWAAYRCGNPNLSRMLLTLGAAAGVQDNVHLKTPLHWACMAKNHGVISMLARKAPDVAPIQNINRMTAYDMVSKVGSHNSKDSKDECCGEGGNIILSLLPKDMAKVLEVSSSARKSLWVSVTRHKSQKG